MSSCSLKWIGDLPFDFVRGTCGTFQLNGVPSIFVCFDENEGKKCRILTRKNDSLLSDIEKFEFEEEFAVTSIPDSKELHRESTIANYKGRL